MSAFFNDVGVTFMSTEITDKASLLRAIFCASVVKKYE